MRFVPMRFSCMFTIVGILFCLSSIVSSQPTQLSGETWGEKLGFPKDKRVLILHADDVGMCYEANAAAKAYLSENKIQSASVMVPCPWFNEIASWYREHPEEDIGLHLALTSEWKYYRWGPVSNPSDVPGLIDDEGYLWRAVREVVMNASAEEVEKEIRAQIDRALERGIQPGHLDTHMGTLYASLGYTKAYLKAAMDYNIPAMVIELTPEVVERFRKQGYPITDEMIAFSAEYTLPKLDDFYAIPEPKSYEEKKQQFFELVKSLKPGITEIIFHPSIETEGLKKITNSWQQRVWEAAMFSDPEVIEFLKKDGVMFTNWKEMMQRFGERVEKK